MGFDQKAIAAPSNSAWQTRHRKAEDNSRRSRVLAGSRVLVVEDEFIIALEIQSVLEEAGATIIGPALTLPSALDLAMQEKITAAMLDLRLGRDSAAAVAAVLAERHVPFLFYTGQPASDPVRRAWPEAKALSKPASDNDIVKAVSEIIRTTH